MRVIVCPLSHQATEGGSKEMQDGSLNVTNILHFSWQRLLEKNRKISGGESKPKELYLKEVKKILEQIYAGVSNNFYLQNEL